MADAVVFDMDGVLVESEHLWEEMWAAYAAERGAEWTGAHTKHVQGMSSTEWSTYLAEFAGSVDPPQEAERLVVDGMIGALEGGRIELLDGAREMVAATAHRAPIALASSASRRLIDGVLAHHGLAGYFGATVSSAEVPRGKPNPDVYLEAARRLGVPPENCLAVEDSSNGLRAAAAAGMVVAAIPNPQYPPADDALAAASFAASEHTEIREFLISELDASSPEAPGHRDRPADDVEVEGTVTGR